MTKETKTILIEVLSDTLEILYKKLDSYSEDFFNEIPKDNFHEEHYATKLRIKEVECALNEVEQ